jgi:hypothetical protein
MSVQFVKQDNHGYSARGEIDGGPSEVVHVLDSRDFTAPGRGYSEREIARSVGCARSSVQIRLWRAECAGITSAGRAGG